MDDAFDSIERALQSGGPDAAFDSVAQSFIEQKNYPLLFETRLMRKRHQLGLPVIRMGTIDDVPEDKRGEYERAFTGAAREVGTLYLADGDIARAWPYFRAVGERAPVAEAIEKLDGREEELESVLQIALEEGVHPRKGFALLLARHGICRAITFFEQYPDNKTRGECIAMLVRSLHQELLENLSRVIAQREGQAPETSSIPALLAGRDWLFGDMDSYVDTSHVISVIRFALDLKEPELLRLAIELCDYGSHLSPQFKYRTEPPFDDVYVDHTMYLKGLLGEDVDASVRHFGAKLANHDSSETGYAPPQVLVAFLARIERYQEAIEVSLEHLSGLDPDQMVCPSVLQLCQLSGDYELMEKLARERGDLLGFLAAATRCPH